MFICGDVSVQPTVIEIPADQDPIGIWPSFDDANGIGHTTIQISYKVGVGGLAKGGGIDVGFAYASHDSVDPNFSDANGWMIGPSSSLAQFPFGRMQVFDSTAPNYTYARTSAQGVQLSTKTLSKSNDGGQVLRVTVGGRPMRKGETISIAFGATFGGNPGATFSFHPGRPNVVYWEDLTNSGTYTLGAGPFPQILVAATQPQQLRVDLPISTTLGKPFEATLQVLQGVDSPYHSLLPVEQFAGAVLLESFERRTEKSLLVNFNGSERGCARFKWTFSRSGSGARRIVATLLDASGARTAVVGVSNAADVRSNQAETAIYCGDLHRHSCEGGHAAVCDLDGWTTLWNRGDDFGCLVEHAANVLAGFQHEQRIAQQFRDSFDPNEKRFVAFPGYEWTLPGQHRHVVCADFSSDPGVTDRGYAGSETPPPVLAEDVATFLALERDHTGQPDRIAIPHHTQWAQQGDSPSYDFGGVLDDPAQPLFEVYSMHGNSEKWVAPNAPLSDYLIHWQESSQRDASANSTAQAALAMGYRYGFVGGSDEHGTYMEEAFYDDGNDTHPAQYPRGGLTFVVAEKSLPTLRQRVWDGLRARRTYVTTGARMLVDFTAQNGRGASCGVGGELTGTTVQFHLRVLPSAIAADHVPHVVHWEIWRDGSQLVGSADLDDEVLDVYFTDPSPPRDGAVHSYYAKAVQADDHVAWISPIWVRYE